MALSTALVLAETYQTALIAIVSGKVSSYTIGDTSFTKHNIDSLERAYKYWRKQASNESNGGNVLLGGVGQFDLVPRSVYQWDDEEIIEA